jgi:GNAT superfamily N-acetyltransferase
MKNMLKSLRINNSEHLLEKWSYGLDRTYPRFCPDFNRDKAEKIIHSNLDELLKLTGSSLGINEAIQLIEPSIAENICREITSILPDWFGIPEVNEKYAKGMLERISFTAIENTEYVGLLSLEIPFANNANIYWLGVKHMYHNKGIGTQLVKAAENYCREKGCNSLTVETLSPKAADKNYLKTYHFYEKLNFLPLFEMHTYGPDHLMVYMQKIILTQDA